MFAKNFDSRLPFRAALCCTCFLFAFAVGVFSAEDEKPAFTILFTAEAHGALLPCDCPLQPLGGVARRATLIKRYRERGPVLVADAGGWAAGGIYDEDSDGDPARDKLRTELMGKAMEKMDYSMIVVGSSDSADAVKAVVNPLRFVTSDSKFFTMEKSVGADVHAFSWPNPKTKEEIAALSWASDPTYFDLHLSTLGEELNGDMASKTKGSLIISAGRKTSTRVSWTVGNTVIANFDYQAQRLGVAEVFPRKNWKEGDAGVRWDIRVKHVPLTADIPDDPEITALLAPHLDTLRKKGKKKVEIEFWTLPRCPFCIKLEPELEKIAADLGDRIAIVPHFLVEKNAGGQFTAMHDEKDDTREITETGIQAIVAKSHPNRFWDWLRWREKNPNASWETGAKELGLLKASIAGALEAKEHLAIFEADYQLSLRRRIQGTPMLIMANKLYDGENERLQILRALCGMLNEPKPDVCKSVPACFHDAECRKRGFVGRCADAGKPGGHCDFSQKAVRVPAQVILEPDALYSNHERILEILLGRLPGIEWTYVDPGTPEGRALVERYKFDRLPAYLIDPVAKTEANYEENFNNAVEAREGALVLKSEVHGAHRIVERARKKGRADLFVSRFSQAGSWAVEVGLEALAWRDPPELVFHDGLYWNERRQPDGKITKELAARGGLAEIEDAALLQAVRIVAPEKLHAYLKERCARRGSQFGWDRALQAAGIDVEKVRALAEGPDQKGPVPEIIKALHAEADLLQSLGSAGDVVLLGENCELIPVHSRDELRYYLEQIGKRRNGK